MYNYANAINMAKNENSETILIKFLQETPNSSKECDTDDTINEVVASVILDKSAAFSLLHGIITMYGLADEDDDE